MKTKKLAPGRAIQAAKFKAQAERWERKAREARKAARCSKDEEE